MRARIWALSLVLVGVEVLGLWFVSGRRLQEQDFSTEGWTLKMRIGFVASAGCFSKLVVYDSGPPLPLHARAPSADGIHAPLSRWRVPFVGFSSPLWETPEIFGVGDSYIHRVLLDPN